MRGFKGLIHDVIRLGQHMTPARSVTSTRLKENVPINNNTLDSKSNKPQKIENDLKNAKPYSEMPKDNLPIVLRTIHNEFIAAGRFYDFLSQKFDEFGPIFKQSFNNFEIVYLADAESTERLHRLEGKYPQRLVLDVWTEWREKSGLESGILISQGERWKRMRVLLDKQMLRPLQVSMFSGNFNDVITDFVLHIRNIRKDNMAIEKLDEELFHWSLETIGTVLYETRFGSFHGTRTPEIAKFIQAVHNMFISTEKISYKPPLFKKMFLSKWQKVHDDAWDVIYNTTKFLVDKRLEEIEKGLQNNKDVSGFLSTLIRSEKMTMDELYGNICELMAAAVDTTSNTMQWCLYELAKRPDLQEALKSEQVTILGNRPFPEYDDLQKMPLLKAVLKETLRMYPIAGVVTRSLVEDFNLCGYRVPKDAIIIVSTYILGRDPNHYEDPNTFKPERWLRSENDSKMHSFSFLPFGHGPRMCVGKRIAELEMHLLLARLVREFTILPSSPEPIHIYNKALLMPHKAVPIKLIDR